MDDLEKCFVHDFYDNPEYNRLFLTSSNQKPWSNVKQFLNDIEPYSLVADIGCGNGKYLEINQNILSFGVDRSNNLLSIASSKHSSSQILLSDNLYLPFRDNLFDAVLSIGVLHHFSTQKRRIKAINELVRILRPNGKIMLYVWAMEQKSREFTSQDILVPLKIDKQIEMLTKKYFHNVKLPDEFKIRKFPFSSYENTFKLVSNEKRYYHVFRENELDDLIKECVNNLIIKKSFYDHGNWCLSGIKC
jgi:ubiquinone/menaquinone biosynthesis C-methylase UbiE